MTFDSRNVFDYDFGLFFKCLQSILLKNETKIEIRVDKCVESLFRIQYSIVVWYVHIGYIMYGIQIQYILQI